MYGAFDGGAVLDLPVELQGDDHPGADDGAVLGADVPDETFLGDIGGERRVPGRAAAVAVQGDRVDGVLGGQRQLCLVGFPAQAVLGDAPGHREVLRVLGLDDGHRLEASAGHPDPQPLLGRHALGAVVGRDPDHILGRGRLPESADPADPATPVRRTAGDPGQQSCPCHNGGQNGPRAPSAPLSMPHEEPNDRPRPGKREYEAVRAPASRTPGTRPRAPLFTLPAQSPPNGPARGNVSARQALGRTVGRTTRGGVAAGTPCALFRVAP